MRPLDLLVLLFLATCLGTLGHAARSVDAIEPILGPDSGMVHWAVAADDDEEAEEDAGEFVIPEAPYNSLDLSSDLDSKVRESYEEAFDLYSAARKSPLSKSKRKDAIRAMKSLLKKMPGGQAHFHLGILYQWDKDYKKAKKVLEQLVEMKPGFYEAYVELGDVEVFMKNMPAAIPLYEQALEIYPYFEYGVDRMMTVLVQLGRFEDSKEFIESAMHFGPNPLRLQCASAVKFALDGPDWGTGFKVETENYVINTDVSEAFGREIADCAELIRELYDTLFPEIDRADRKYQVYVFKDRAGYLAAGAPASSGGVYMSLSRRLMLYKKETMESTLMTLKHEGFHQYCHEFLDNIPSWFNEGLADTFAATELVMNGKKRAMQLLPNKERVGYLKRALNGGSYPPLSALMMMSQREMYDVENDNKKMYLHYCQAWGICYFCITGGKPKYQTALKQYFKLLRKGKDQAEAYQSTFGKLNMRKFQDEWHAYMLGSAS